MLTVIIRHRENIVYLRPFNSHKEAIDHFCELYGNLFDDAELELTNDTIIPMKAEPEEPFYVR